MSLTVRPGSATCCSSTLFNFLVLSCQEWNSLPVVQTFVLKTGRLAVDVDTTFPDRDRETETACLTVMPRALPSDRWFRQTVTNQTEIFRMCSPLHSDQKLQLSQNTGQKAWSFTADEMTKGTVLQICSQVIVQPIGKNSVKSCFKVRCVKIHPRCR